MIIMYARPTDLSLQAMTVHVLLAKSLWIMFCFIGEIKITQTTEQNLQLFTTRQRNSTLHYVLISVNV